MSHLVDSKQVYFTVKEITQSPTSGDAVIYLAPSAFSWAARFLQSVIYIYISLMPIRKWRGVGCHESLINDIIKKIHLFII